MKTIMINDVVYEKLSVVKDNRSFSELLGELLAESRAARLYTLRKYFGVVGDKEAKAMRAASRKIRKELVIR